MAWRHNGLLHDIADDLLHEGSDEDLGGASYGMTSQGRC